MCLFVKDGPPDRASYGCIGSGYVENGSLWSLGTEPYGPGGAPEQVIIGTAPDGNSSVTVNWSDGGSTVLPVTDNVYSVPVGSHTGWTSVTLENSAGDVVNVAGMPTLP